MTWHAHPLPGSSGGAKRPSMPTGMDHPIKTRYWASQRELVAASKEFSRLDLCCSLLGHNLMARLEECLPGGIREYWSLCSGCFARLTKCCHMQAIIVA